MSDGTNRTRFMNYYNMEDVISKLYYNENANYNNLLRKCKSKKNILLALKILGDNPGRNTAGPDGMTYNEVKDMDMDRIYDEVNKRLRGKIKPQGRRVGIPKDNGKVRILGITNILDRLAQQSVLNILQPITEKRFMKSSFGFRPNLRAQHAVSRVAHQVTLNCIRHKYPIWVLDYDLKSCFDTINLSKAIECLIEDFGISDIRFIKAIKRLMWIEYEGEKYDGIGVAQGSILGPLLCNVLLHRLDVVMYELYNGHVKYEAIRKHGRRDYRNKTYEKFREQYGDCIKIEYVRYADDFLIICNYEEDIVMLKSIVKDVISGLELTINEDKSKVLKIGGNSTDKLDFLGYKIGLTKNGITISPKDSGKTYRTIKSKLSKCIRRSYNGKINNPHYINEVCSGYIYYYDICTNISNLIDKINQYLYLKCRRYKHIRRLEVDGKFHYEFGMNPKSEIRLWDMRKISNKSYKDYLKNIPYWKPERSKNEYQWLDKQLHGGGLKCIYLPGLVSKYRKDPIIDKALSEIDIIEIHHIKPKSSGGKDTFANLIPLSRISHRLIHMNKDTAENYIKANNVKVNKRELNKYRTKANKSKI